MSCGNPWAKCIQALTGPEQKGNNDDVLKRGFYSLGLRLALVSRAHQGTLRRRNKASTRAARDRSEVARLKAEGLNPTQIAAKLGINRVTVYRLTAELGKDGKEAA